MRDRWLVSRGKLLGIGMLAALAAAPQASAKRPDPASVADLGRCVELTRSRLFDVAATTETASTIELATVAGEAVVGVVLEARRAASGAVEIVIASHLAPSIGQRGTFGPWAVTIVDTSFQRSVATVDATLEQALAQKAKDRVVKLLGSAADPGDVPGFTNLMESRAGGMGVAPEVVTAAVEAMNRQGGLPWIAWADGGRARRKRLKVEPGAEGNTWVPLVGADSALGPLAVVGLDLEGTGRPYLFIAMNDSPMSNTTEVWRANDKGKWSRFGETSGNLVAAARVAGKVELVFENTLDASVWRFDPATRKWALQCLSADGSELMSSEDAAWAKVLASPAQRRVRGAGSTHYMTSTTTEPSDSLAGLTMVWPLRVNGSRTLVAYSAPARSIEKHLRPIAARVVSVSWITTLDLE